MPNAHQDRLRREKVVLEITDDLLDLARLYLKFEVRAGMTLEEHMAELSAVPAYQRRRTASACKRQAEAKFQPVKDRFYVEVPTPQGRAYVLALAQKKDV